MNNVITYCFWGEGFNQMEFDLGSDFVINIDNKKCVKRNQIVILINILANEGFSEIFGDCFFEETVDIQKNISKLILSHPQVKVYKNIFDGIDTRLNGVTVKSFSKFALYDLNNRSHNEEYCTTLVFIDTDDINKRILQVDALFTSFKFYDELGFVVLEKEQLLHYLEKSNISTDLLSQIEDSDISENLANRGNLSIFWGFRPWYYNIIVTQQLDFQLPLGLKVHETGFSKFSCENVEQFILPGEVMEDLKTIDNYKKCSFLNESKLGYSIKFYVAGGRSGLQEFEGLNVFVHIELLTSVENILEFDQID
ncbi:hypothetical protein GNY06_04785, partial [Elizabethkingia argentiflava]